MQSDSIESSGQRTGPEITKSQQAHRTAEAREAERAAQRSESDQRREAAKSDPTRGENVDTFA